jgi:hypothetical protein
MKKRLYLTMVLCSGLFAGDAVGPAQDIDMAVVAHEIQALDPVIPTDTVRPLTNAQQDVIAQMVADVEGVESCISRKEMVVEKIKDVLRVIGRRIQRVWNWGLKKIGF